MDPNPYTSPKMAPRVRSRSSARMAAAVTVVYLCTAILYSAVYCELRWAGNDAWLGARTAQGRWFQGIVESYLLAYPYAHIVPLVGTAAYAACLWFGGWRYRLLASVPGVPLVWLVVCALLRC